MVFEISDKLCVQSIYEHWAILRLIIGVNNVIVIIKVDLINTQNVGPLSAAEECGKVKKGAF